MGSVGPMELLVVLVFALLIFGPKKLPEIGRGVGSALREFKRHSRDLMSYLDEEPEPRRVYPEATPSIRPAESYPSSLAETYPEDAAATPADDAKDGPVERATDTAEDEPRERTPDTAEPPSVMPPSPTPSNTHPTT